MLYDKRWDKSEVKTDPLTLESLVAWLETMPARKCYDFMDCSGKCLYGQYMTAHGISWEESGASSYGFAPKERDEFCSLVYEKVAGLWPYTFGAALTRARAALLGD
jgi:hypothetical protein